MECFCIIWEIQYNDRNVQRVHDDHQETFGTILLILTIMKYIMMLFEKDILRGYPRYWNFKKRCNYYSEKWKRLTEGQNLKKTLEFGVLYAKGVFVFIHKE